MARAEWQGLSGMGLLRIGFELRTHLALLELLGETLVIAPEQANIWNVKQHHGQTLQTQPNIIHTTRLIQLELYGSSSSSRMLIQQTHAAEC